MSSNSTPASSKPLVSVVVPTYNYGHFITETFESLRAQTYPYWECVVVDDGSTDDTAEVVKRFAETEPRITYVRQENQRQSVAKNNGLAHTNGQYVQFLDADDLLESRKFEQQVEYLESHPETDIVYSGVHYFVAECGEESSCATQDEDPAWMTKTSGAGREVVRQLLLDNIMVINSPLVRRSLIERVGPFDARLPPAEDWDYWLRCAMAGGRFQFQDGEGVRALVRSHQISSSQNRIRMYRVILLMREKLDALLSDDELRRLNHQMMAVNEGWLGLEEAASGSPLRAVSHLVSAGVAAPRWNWRLKWFLCALCAPFTSPARLRTLISTSITGTIMGLRRRKPKREFM